MKSLKQILQNKDTEVQRMLAAFDKEVMSFSLEARKMISRLFRDGVYDIEEIQLALEPFKEVAEDWAARQAKMVSFSKQVAVSTGVSFAMTEDGINKLMLLQENNLEKMASINDLYARDIQKFGIQSAIEGKSLKEITAGLGDYFETMGRRLNTEAFTGMNIASAAINKDAFENAGIDKFYYAGPYDGKTREACEATLKDEKQATGWTAEQIAQSQTPFIERGGYNCRHEWLPFVE